MDQTKVLYDRDCGFCRMLADFAKKRCQGRLIFESWQDFHQDRQEQTKPDMLCLLKDGYTYGGKDAWRRLLELHPDLSALNWLAQKLGMLEQTAALISSSADLLRRLCKKC